MDFVQGGEELEGRVTRSVYKGPLGDPPDLLFQAYQAALQQDGFEILYTCATEECGGIRFYQTLEPVRRMHTDPWNYRYLAARKGAENARTYLAFLISPTRGNVYAARIVIERPKTQPVAETQTAQLEDRGVRVSDADTAEEPEVDPETDLETLSGTEETDPEAEFLDAEAMAERIAANGSVALYSIFYDTNSASLRGESAPTLEEVVHLLSAHPNLNLIVVGHTDNVGRLHYNLQLSERRAAAMVKQLVNQYGVDKRRLRSAGVGFLAPVASNGDESGRSKNRRVELVAD